MNLETYAEIIGKEIKVNYYHDQKRFTASITGAYIAEGGMLCSASENGNTPEEAIEKYFNHIQGKVLVFYPFSPERQEFKVPVFKGE